MQRAAIVPDHQIVPAPLVAVDKLILGGEIGELLEEFRAFAVIHAYYAPGYGSGSLNYARLTQLAGTQCP